MNIFKNGRVILFLIILLTTVAMNLESCKKADTTPVDNNPTAALPVVTTNEVSSITPTSAVSSSYISSDGGSPILSRGVVWSTISNPTIALTTKTSDAPGIGGYLSNLTGLDPVTNYFVRAYATTSSGTAYGNVLSFTTSIQIGINLVGSGATGNAKQGNAVSISGDGNTLVFSGPADNNNAGAIWIYNRTNTGWNQVVKLDGFGALGNSQGQVAISNVAISADGKTIIVGAPGDNSGTGAAWIFTLNNGIWAQQGNKLVGTGAVGKAYQGSSVSISGDGNTVVIGGVNDSPYMYGLYTLPAGASWIFTRNNGIWTQQGSKLVGTGGGDAGQGFSVSLDGDGNTVVIGGYDYLNNGGAWVFTRNNGIWAQQGSRLVGTGGVGNANQGSSVSISGDGNTIISGGWGYFSPNGASWIFTRNTGIWVQQGSELVGTGNVGNSMQGNSVSISADGKTAAVGGPGDNGNKGAVWIFNL